ncbi:hypothetical protein [Spirosoma profusum]|nr:hypothetical protein [Spirosoma profusum]
MNNVERSGWYVTSFLSHCALFILHYSLTFAQSPTQEQLSGVWIGVHTEWDTDFSCALPTYLTLDANGTYHFGMVDGSAQELVATWAVQHDSIRLDTIRYAPGLITVQENLLRIGKNYPMVFRRFTDIPFDSSLVRKALAGRVWQSDSLTIYLYANGQVALENPITKQRTAHFWQLAQFGQSVFLVIRGNPYNQYGGYKPLWQLRSISSKQLQVIGSSSHNAVTQNFRFVRNLNPTDTCRPSGFQTCSNCYRREWYETLPGQNPRRYDVLQVFAKYYQPIRQAGESGLLRIRFGMNCEGKIGTFELKGFGEDYCPKTFTESITSQLQDICRNHIATDVTLRQSNRPDGRMLDVAVSLVFRLKDGRIADILP